MAVNKRQEFIMALCREAGGTGPPDVLVEDWESQPCVLLRAPS